MLRPVRLRSRTTVTEPKSDAEVHGQPRVHGRHPDGDGVGVRVPHRRRVSRQRRGADRRASGRVRVPGRRRQGGRGVPAERPAHRPLRLLGGGRAERESRPLVPQRRASHRRARRTPSPHFHPPAGRQHRDPRGGGFARLFGRAVAGRLHRSRDTGDRGRQHLHPEVLSRRDADLRVRRGAQRSSDLRVPRARVVDPARDRHRGGAGRVAEQGRPGVAGGRDEPSVRHDGPLAKGLSRRRILFRTPCPTSCPSSSPHSVWTLRSWCRAP